MGHLVLQLLMPNTLSEAEEKPVMHNVWGTLHSVPWQTEMGSLWGFLELILVMQFLCMST